MIDCVFVVFRRLGDGAVLLIRRRLNDETLPGQWALPGGKVEPGEHPYQAMVREAIEEVGMLPALSGKIADGDFLHRGREYRYQAWVSWKFQGAPTVKPDVDGAAWFTPTEALAMTNGPSAAILRGVVA